MAGIVLGFDFFLVRIYILGEKSPSMIKRCFLVFLLFPVFLIACNPGISVVIANRSSTDKEIRVAYPANFKLPMDVDLRSIDSLTIYNLSEHYFSSRDRVMAAKRIPVVSLDTVARSWSFHLKAGHKAIVESRYPASRPTYGQVFIIDQADTIELKRREKVFVKRPKLYSGGSWTYTITE
jgi:hypothetical protein